ISPAGTFDIDRLRAMRPRAVAQLPVAVVAPAERLPRSRRGTRMRTECADGDERVTAGHLHGLTAVRGPSVPELTVRVTPPAPRLSVGRHATGVHRPSGDRHEMLVAPHPHRRRAWGCAPIAK